MSHRILVRFHSIAFLGLFLPAALLPSCSSRQQTVEATSAGGHVHHAPHHGYLVELGDEFAHLELVLDPSSGQITAFALDGEAENPVRLKQHVIIINVTDLRIDLTLKPVSSFLTGESDGDTSQFTAQSDRLKNVTTFTGLLNDLTIRGTDFTNVQFTYAQPH